MVLQHIRSHPLSRIGIDPLGPGALQRVRHVETYPPDAADLHVHMLAVLQRSGSGHSESKVRGPAPELGQHTEEILLEIGYTWEDIATLRAGGALG